MMTRIANEGRPDLRSTTTAPPPTVAGADIAGAAGAVDGADDIVTLARAGGDDSYAAGAGAGAGKGYTVEGDEGGRMGRLPPPRSGASTFKDVAQATQKLEREFGVTVRGDFSLEELSRVHESLRLMGKVEKAAMKGVELRREAQPSATIAERHGDGVGAFFDRGDAVDTATGARLSGPSITFFDGAFPGGDGTDARDRRFTMHAVLHEVGHAIEGHAVGDALARENEGLAKVNVENAAQKALEGEYATARAALFATLALDPSTSSAPPAPSPQETSSSTEDLFAGSSSDFFAAHDPLNDTAPASDNANDSAVDTSAQKPSAPAVDPKAKAFIDATNAWQAAQNALSKAQDPQKRAAAMASLSAAQKAVTTTLKALPATHPAKPDATRYATVIGELHSIQQRSFQAEKIVDEGAKKVDRLVVTRDNPKTPGIDETQSRLEALFEEATADDNAVTTYGEASPVENFAEAYSLYRRDPHLLSKEARRFFDKKLK
jgi:hypothetical protein